MRVGTAGGIDRIIRQIIGRGTILAVNIHEGESVTRSAGRGDGGAKGKSRRRGESLSPRS